MSDAIDMIRPQEPAVFDLSSNQQVELSKKACAFHTDTMTLPSKSYTNPQQEMGIQALSARPRLEKPTAADIDIVIEEFAFIEETDLPPHVIMNPEQEKVIAKEPAKVEQPVKDLSSLKTFEKEVEKTFETVSAADELDGSKSYDAMLFKMMVTFLNAHRELEEGLTEILFNDIRLQESQQKELREQNLNVKDDHHQRQQTSEMLGWVNMGLTTTLIASSLAVFFTGGVGSLASFALSSLGVLNGMTTISKAMIDYKNDKKLAELFNLGKDQTNVHSLIQNGIDAMSSTMKQISEIWRTLRDIAERRKEAIKFY